MRAVYKIGLGMDRGIRWEERNNERKGLRQQSGELGGPVVEPPILARSVIGGSRIFRRWCPANHYSAPETSTGQKIDLISGCR